MSNTIGRSRGYFRWLHELVFSIYFSFLVVSAHEAGDHPWSGRLLSYFLSHGYAQRPMGIEDYRVYTIDFSLLWLSAVLIFLLLRLFSGFSLTRVVLRGFAGFVAIAGFPLALAYGHGETVLSIQFGLVIAGVCLVLWKYPKWSASSRTKVLLLIIYFIVWSTIGGGYRLSQGCLLLWPSWYLGWYIPWHVAIWEHGWLAYPFLDLCSTLLWAKYLKLSGQRAEPIKNVA